ncbi:DUF2493 domain-containing protein [Nocardia cyriacigeorgica]|uniref:SLOG family protein n=1 Tax=Nocardia cyriacigeorgica TaxID=135487 RepID=UPI0013BD5541|nr:SLOG family protein [Nocardia cyriacigeorgica]NEW49357.1 DUF2493 domain-containing protein [Nocardia cyriacigeorgica]
MTGIARRVLVTGSRSWPTPSQVWAELDEIRGLLHPGDTITVVHGGARGADTAAATWCKNRADTPGADIVEERHPADWDQHGRAAGHIRNAEMVALGADICLAFANGDTPGTRGCVSAAARARIQLRTIHPTSLNVDTEPK